MLSTKQKEAMQSVLEFIAIVFVILFVVFMVKGDLIAICLFSAIVALCEIGKFIISWMLYSPTQYLDLADALIWTFFLAFGIAQI